MDNHECLECTRVWVRIPVVTLVSMDEQAINFNITSLNQGVTGHLWGQRWFLCLVKLIVRYIIWQHLARAVYSKWSWDGLRNEKALWSGVVMLEALWVKKAAPSVTIWSRIPLGLHWSWFNRSGSKQDTLYAEAVKLWGVFSFPNSWISTAILSRLENYLRSGLLTWCFSF